MQKYKPVVCVVLNNNLMGMLMIIITKSFKFCNKKTPTKHVFIARRKPATKSIGKRNRKRKYIRGVSHRNKSEPNIGFGSRSTSHLDIKYIAKFQ